MSKTHLVFVIRLILLFTLASGCRPAELAVSDAYRCDDFTAGQCVIPKQINSNYTPKLPPERLRSWQALSNYLYFHSRDTPGLRINFNRTLSKEELQQMQSGLICRYQLKKDDEQISGELEGVRVDRNGFWCFDYLGAILIDFIKKTNHKNTRPDHEIFPLTMIFHYISHNPTLSGEFKSEIYINWNR